VIFDGQAIDGNKNSAQREMAVGGMWCVGGAE